MKIFNFDASNIDLNAFMPIDSEKVSKLLQDEIELEEKELQEIKKIKNNIILGEALHINEENILGDIQLITNSIPTDITPIEKVRWVYMKLGQLFSYDYRVIHNPEFGTAKILDKTTFIGRHQTCIQISDILSDVLNTIDDVECKVIERPVESIRGSYGENHVANEVKVKIDDGYYETYMLDLTVDLYLIQSGCMTKHFGYESGSEGQYDIIPKIDFINWDKKLGLINGDKYTDEIIEEYRLSLKAHNYSGMTDKEIVEFFIKKINELSKTFHGYHEGKQYNNLLFKELLFAKYKEFNIHSVNESSVNLKTCYLIEYNDYLKWIIYSNNLGFMSTDIQSIKKMLDNGWITKSQRLENEVYDISKKTL